MVAKPVTSKHLRTTTELTLVAPIKAKFARTDANDSVAYASRLGLLLKTFFELRRVSIERAVDGAVGPLERMRSLYNFSWSVFDEGSKLLLSVTFDRPWEPYIRAIVDLSGPFLDAIFCHCEGYDEASTDQGYVGFAEWVRRHQIDVSLFYAAEPDLTVDDQRFLREFERLHRERAAQPTFEQRIARLSLNEPDVAPLAAVPSLDELARRQHVLDQRLARAAAAMVQLRQMFHRHPGDPDEAAQARERGFFDRAAWLLLEPLAGRTEREQDRALADLPGPLGAALSEMRALARPPAAAAGACPELPAASVQGNILAGYPRMTHGCLLLVGFDGPQTARQFVGRIAQQITTHDRTRTGEMAVNVALTFEGLRTLGLTDQELDLFPIEFREGMAARAGLLGDVGAEHPDNWSGPRREGTGGDGADAADERVSLAEVDLALILQCNDDSLGDPAWDSQHPLYQLARQLGVPSDGVNLLSVELLRREFMSVTPGAAPLVKERFGFADGVSQPIAGDDTAPAGDRVAVGEILVGYPGDRGDRGRYPTGPELYTKDGSFLVVRKLEQDVAAFEAFIDENAGQFGGGREELYTKIMGRRRDGWSPVSPASLNDFDYSRDAAGELCPLASHVRRANPRTPVATSVHGLPLRVPRIARRGFSFGPSASAPGAASRGLLFMAYNASIAEQFEVIQRWLNGANSTGVLSAQADPLVSHRHDQVITLLDGRQPRYLVKTRPFVKLLWGNYFFAPSKEALQRLAALETARTTAPKAPGRAADGQDIIHKLQALERLDASHVPSPRATFAWKRLLEDRAPASREAARAVWAAIVERGGALRTPYAVLVGGARLVRTVMGDESRFSVAAYGERMEASVGRLYLGMDRCPVTDDPDADVAAAKRYAAAATLPNQFMARLGRRDAFELARRATKRHFSELAPLVDLTELAKRVVGEVCREWFGLPRDRAGYDLFHTAALAIFCPHPAGAVRDAARAALPSLAAAQRAAVDAGSALATFLDGEQGDGLASALIGGAQGTLAATVGSFLSVAGYCLEHDRLARLEAWLKSEAGRAWLRDPALGQGASQRPLIEREVLHALQRQPAPDLLHRVAVKPTTLGGVPIEAGEMLVVSLASAIASAADEEERTALLFGGVYPATVDASESPKHPCPGREAAIGIIFGMLAVLLQRGVRREGLLRVSPRDWDQLPE